MILDMDGKEVIQAGQYYGPGWTNNEAKSFRHLGCPAMFVQAHSRSTSLKASRPSIWG